MPIEFQTVPRFEFPSRVGFPQKQELVVKLAAPPRNAVAVINGFSLRFTNADHHLYHQEVDTSVTILGGTEVLITVKIALRDKSGTFDDPYDGYVDVVLLVDS